MLRTVRWSVRLGRLGCLRQGGARVSVGLRRLLRLDGAVAYSVAGTDLLEPPQGGADACALGQPHAGGHQWDACMRGGTGTALRAARRRRVGAARNVSRRAASFHAQRPRHECRLHHAEQTSVGAPGVRAQTCRSATAATPGTCSRGRRGHRGGRPAGRRDGAAHPTAQFEMPALERVGDKMPKERWRPLGLQGLPLLCCAACAKMRAACALSRSSRPARVAPRPAAPPAPQQMRASCRRRKPGPLAHLPHALPQHVRALAHLPHAQCEQIQVHPPRCALHEHVRHVPAEPRCGPQHQTGKQEGADGVRQRPAGVVLRGGRGWVRWG